MVIVRNVLYFFPAVAEWSGGVVRWCCCVGFFWSAGRSLLARQRGEVGCADCVVQVDGIFVALVVRLVVVRFSLVFFLGWVHELVEEVVVVDFSGMCRKLLYRSSGLHGRSR